MNNKYYLYNHNTQQKYIFFDDQCVYFKNTALVSYTDTDINIYIISISLPHCHIACDNDKYYITDVPAGFNALSYVYAKDGKIFGLNDCSYTGSPQGALSALYLAANLKAINEYRYDLLKKEQERRAAIKNETFKETITKPVEFQYIPKEPVQQSYKQEEYSPSYKYNEDDYIPPNNNNNIANKVITGATVGGIIGGSGIGYFLIFFSIVLVVGMIYAVFAGFESYWKQLIEGIPNDPSLSIPLITSIISTFISVIFAIKTKLSKATLYFLITSGIGYGIFLLYNTILIINGDLDITGLFLIDLFGIIITIIVLALAITGPFFIGALIINAIISGIKSIRK